MSALYFYDDAAARCFEPFSLMRPVAELRLGARLIRERWALATGATPAGFVAGAHLADFDEPGAVQAAGGMLPAGALLVNSRFAPVLTIGAGKGDVLIAGDRVAAVRLTQPLDTAELADGTLELDALAGDRPRTAVEGWWLDHAWDLLKDLESRLGDDLARMTAGRGTSALPQCAIVGNHQVFLAGGAAVEPFVTFDCTNGPVVIESGAVVQSFTRVQGPTWIGPHSIVGGDKITVCAIGDHCKVHGEISTTVMVGYANKSHDGFVGQSYLGRWVNIGAMTVTSNLKNTYGPVALWTPNGTLDTGMQFLGTLFGDHAKTGIATALTTGCVLGAGAQVFGAEMQPKVVPPFAWGSGEPFGTFDIDKFITVAERVMARRDIVLTDRGRAYLRAAFARRWSVSW